MGRKKKFGEETDFVNVRVPKSKKAKYREAINNLVDEIYKKDSESIKLFITNRYVSLPKENYEMLEVYYSLLSVLNGQLRIIENDLKNTFEFLKEEKEADQELFENIRGCIEKILERELKNLI